MITAAFKNSKNRATTLGAMALAFCTVFAAPAFAQGDSAFYSSGIDIPEYPSGAIVSAGAMSTHVVGEEDTLADIARAYNLGFVELRAANPEADPWMPTPGAKIILPTLHIIPRGPQNGIIINLSEMRLYHFHTKGKPPASFPIGVGREGLLTPTGSTFIARKQVGPSWHPTERMRQEKPELPEVVGPGPSNPLGTHAMYLDWPTFLIHGTNKPWGIGRRVSSGCIRMYPEDIITLFHQTEKGTPVTVVNQPVKIAWLNDGLYLEAHPSIYQANQTELEGGKPRYEMEPGLLRSLIDTAGADAINIDWKAVRTAIKTRNGYPMRIVSLEKAADKKPQDEKKAQNEKPESEKTASAQDRAPATEAEPASGQAQ